MIVLISGASHTGKTVLAQRLLEKHGFPYLSIDHLKMGLIRSGQTKLTPMDDDLLTDYLWPIVREMIKTAVENHQHMIVEGCYIPYDWKKDFEPEYLRHMRAWWLVMSRSYIENHFDEICKHACDVEKRLDDDCQMEWLIDENEETLKQCRLHGCDYVLIDGEYSVEVDLSVGKEE